jgi:ferredoxin
MRISVTQDACVGAGQCALVAPELFDQDDEGIVIALTLEVPEGQEAQARKAASLCPARAIQLIES